MDSIIKVGIIQYNIKWLDIPHNLAELEEIIATYFAKENFDIIVLPEMFNTGFGNVAANMAEYMNGRSVKWLCNMSQMSDSLMVGSLGVKENSKTHNRLLAISPDLQIYKYDKVHLFGIEEEKLSFTSGEKSKPFNFKNFNFKSQICYDLRFPVSAAQNALNPLFDCLIYVANWPSSRRRAWDNLLKARAIENQSYVIACNRIGIDGNGIKYDGGSAVYDYEGNDISNTRSFDHFDIVEAEISLNNLITFRNSFPFLSDRDSFNLQ